MGAERDRVAGFGRLEDGLLQAGEWYRWGPYVSERQWGTVREDYSADGEAWDYLPHDQARSRAYRWGEDGLAGFCDVEQRLCLGLALWNGKDPILKERAFGLTGAQGNHGEDVKEYWWYLDATPSHAWNRWRYHYPQGEYPYEDLIDVNGARNKFEPEYELLDTGMFDEDKYWITDVHYAKASADDLLMTVQVTNAGPRPRRCTCCRPPGSVTPGRGTWTRPSRSCGRWAIGGGHRSPVRRPDGAAGRPGRTGRCRPRCSARTRPTTRSCSAARRSRRTRRTASTTTWSLGRPPSTRSARGPRRRSGTRLTAAPGERSSCGCGCARRPPRPPAATANDPLGAQYTQVIGSARPRPTSSTPT